MSSCRPVGSGGGCLYLCPGSECRGRYRAVGTCTNLAFYPTIQLAINSVPAGSTVKVCPGTYAEQITITKKLTLTSAANGASDAIVIVPPPGGIAQNGYDIFGNPVAAQIFVASHIGSVTISHLTVDGMGNNLAGCVTTTFEGIYFQNTSGTITGNAVRNQYQTDYAGLWRMSERIGDQR